MERAGAPVSSCIPLHRSREDRSALLRGVCAGGRVVRGRGTVARDRREGVGRLAMTGRKSSDLARILLQRLRLSTESCLAGSFGRQGLRTSDARLSADRRRPPTGRVPARPTMNRLVQLNLSPMRGAESVRDARVLPRALGQPRVFLKRPALPLVLAGFTSITVQETPGSLGGRKEVEQMSVRGATF